MKQLLEQAVCFAAQCHAGQLRKGTDIPYIVHPLEVMTILMRMRTDTDLLIAGLLHDTLEDTAATAAEIAERFGQKVADLVSAHSEDKSKTWQQRKEAAIAETKTADRRLQMLILADKLSNLRSMANDYAALGEELWKRFNAPAEKQSWYYSEIQDALYDLQYDSAVREAYWEMVARYKDVFVRHFISSDHTRLYQLSRHGTAVVLKNSLPVWIEVDGVDPAELIPITRADAELTEDRWSDLFMTEQETDEYPC